MVDAPGEKYVFGWILFKVASRALNELNSLKMRSEGAFMNIVAGGAFVIYDCDPVII